MFFMFIAVYIFRHIVPLLYLNVKQVEDSENIYGVLSVFVKALPYTHINLPYKLQFISLQLSESPK